MARRRHILFILEYYPPHVGGVETLFANLTAALARRGYRVSVVTLWLPGSPTRETVDGVEIIRVRTPQRARRYLFMLLALPAALRRARSADIIHTTTYNAAILAWLVATARRIPSVITVHEVFGEQWNNLLGLHPLVGYAFRLFEWGILRLPFRHFICDSRFTAQRLRDLMNVPAAKVSVAYPAVDYDFWDAALHRRRNVKEELALAEDTFLYLYFGRPGISKGVEYLIDAARQVRAELPGSRLVLLLARDPLAPYQRILRTIAREGLADHITVLDPAPRAELPTYLLAADCVVVPSVSEGFGYSAIEAVTIGCPLVATSGHSVEEVLDGCAAFVPPRDPAALARAILEVARERPQWREPKRYDIAQHVAGIDAVYEQLVSADTVAESGESPQPRSRSRRAPAPQPASRTPQQDVAKE